MYVCCLSFFFFKQKTAYEMRISDWSSDVCSSDLGGKAAAAPAAKAEAAAPAPAARSEESVDTVTTLSPAVRRLVLEHGLDPTKLKGSGKDGRLTKADVLAAANAAPATAAPPAPSAAAPTPPPTCAPARREARSTARSVGKECASPC